MRPRRGRPHFCAGSGHSRRDTRTRSLPPSGWGALGRGGSAERPRRGNARNRLSVRLRLPQDRPAVCRHVCWMRLGARPTTSEARLSAGPSWAIRNPYVWRGELLGTRTEKATGYGREEELRPQRSWRPSSERLRVTSSAYSRWPPTGSPCARRVRRMPWGLTRRAR